MFKEFIKKNLVGKIAEAVLLLAAILMGFYFQWEISNLVFFTLFIVLILHPISSRFSVLGAIMLIISTAALLAFKQNNWAETTAIWAYYLMIFTLFMLINELKEDGSKERVN